MSWRRFEDVFKTSWRRLEDDLKRSWRRFEDVLKMSSKRLEKVLERLLKMSWRRLEDIWPWRICWSWPRRLEGVFWRRKAKANLFVLIKTSWRRLEDLFWRRRRKTSSWRLQDVFVKMNVCWDLLRKRGKGKYGNEVTFKLLSFSNNFSKDNYHI